MSNTAEVAVVGGGAAGCAVAYYLAWAGAKPTIIEREGVGTQASGYSAGALHPLHQRQGSGIPGPLGPLAMESYRMHLELWGQLQAETGIDCQGRTVSLVKVAFEEAELAELQETLELFTAADGFEAHWLGKKEVYELEPRIGPGVICGLYTHGVADLDSYKYTLALAEAAQKLGATVRAATVDGLGHFNGRVTGISLGNGEVPCDQVVLAMGPWSRNAEAWLNTYIPVDPLKGEILQLELPGRALGHVLSGGGGFLYPKPDGLVWCGDTEEWQGFNRQPSQSARQSILQRAIRLLPDLAQARLVEQTASLRPVTPDRLPIIGRVPGWDNVYLATGAAQKGTLLSPAMGKAVSDLITQGATQLPIDAFGLERFAAMRGLTVEAARWAPPSSLPQPPQVPTCWPDNGS